MKNDPIVKEPTKPQQSGGTGTAHVGVKGANPLKAGSNVQLA